MIKVENIHRNYDNIEVLKGVSFEIDKGEIISIVGASGAGKTTLLQIMGTLEKPSKGRVLIDGVDMSTLSEKKISAYRNENIGFIFQFHQLLPEFTALENICLPAFVKGTPKSEAEKHASELLSFLGLANRASHKPSQLSGGEQQRVAVARALINNPLVVFADEPSGNLDSKSAENLHQLFFDLREEFNHTFVIVTHNAELANMADKKLIMQDGDLLIN